jgi:hypothetical protein
MQNPRGKCGVINKKVQTNLLDVEAKDGVIGSSLGSVSSSRTHGKVVGVKRKGIKMKGIESHLETKIVYARIFLFYHTESRSGLNFTIIFFFVVVVAWTR